MPTFIEGEAAWRDLRDRLRIIDAVPMRQNLADNDNFASLPGSSPRRRREAPLCNRFRMVSPSQFPAAFALDFYPIDFSFVPENLSVDRGGRNSVWFPDRQV